MADLTQEKLRLLDRLYNLRGDESIVTTSIQTRIDDIISSTDETERVKREQEGIKTDLESELNTFTKQATSFLEAFSKYDNDSFEALNAVDVNIELGSLVQKLQDEKPRHENQLNEKISDTEKIIEDKKVEIEKLNENKKEEEEKLQNAENVKVKLNNLLDDILVNENDSYNRGYIKKLLTELGVFNDDETSELEFLILFPEKGLSEYVNEYKDREDKFIPVFDRGENNIFAKDIVIEEDEEAEEPTEEVEETVEETEENNIIEEVEETEEPAIIEEEEEEIAPIIEEKEEDIITLYNEEPEESEMNLFEDKNIIEEVNEPEEVQQPEESELSKILSELNIDESKLDDKTKEILSNTDESIIRKNDEHLRSIDFAKEDEPIRFDNYMYLADEELGNKITFLRSKGITDKTIKKEFLAGNIKYSVESLKNKFESLKTNNVEIKDNNINLLELDIAKYYENIDKLNKAGIELDEKESKIYKELLSTTDYIDANTEILKNYLIKIVRKNGKYAVDTLWNSPVELSTEIDQLLENDLERLIESNPEVLGKNVETVLKVINYFKENNIPVIDEDNQNTFYKYIYDYEEFRKLFKTAELKDLTSLKSNNDAIIEAMNNDLTKKIITSLDEVYNKENYEEINLDPTSNDKYNRLKDDVINTLKAEQVSGNIYKIHDELISKNKIERNAKYIIDVLAKDGESLEGLEKNILLIAALYNLRLPENDVKDIVNDYIGFIG